MLSSSAGSSAIVVVCEVDIVVGCAIFDGSSRSSSSSSTVRTAFEISREAYGIFQKEAYDTPKTPTEIQVPTKHHPPLHGLLLGGNVLSAQRRLAPPLAGGALRVGGAGHRREEELAQNVRRAPPLGSALEEVREEVCVCARRGIKTRPISHYDCKEITFSSCRVVVTSSIYS